VGIVATSNHGPNQNNSDFYITLSAENTQPLNMKHTIFGQVQEGLDVLVRMNEIHVDEQFRPLLNIRIRHTTILDDPFEDPPQLKPVSRSPSPKTFKGFGRLEYEEKEELIDKMDLKNEHELIELAQEHKAKSRAVVLEMLEDIPDADIKPYPTSPNVAPITSSTSAD
jgi:peptidyl-prolyl cis-trans isomerase-like 4